MRKPTYHALLIADSRAYSFNKYKVDQKIYHKSHYIIKRGGTTRSLLERTLEFLKSDKISKNDWLIVKIAAGINDITYRQEENGEIVLKHKGTNEAIKGLLKLREEIYKIRPKTVVSFITIPPAHILKNKELKGLNCTAKDIEENKAYVDKVLDLNTKLEDLNRNQCATIIQPHCCCWHPEAIRSSKKTLRQGGYRKRITVNKKALYDGLHAVSDVKKKTGS